MNVLQNVEGDFIAAAKAGWVAVEAKVEALLPTLRADLTALVQEVANDLEAGASLEDMETGLLNLAESKGAQFVLELGSEILQALLASAIAGL